MANVELGTYIEQENEQNPLLECDHGAREIGGAEESPGAAADYGDDSSDAPDLSAQAVTEKLPETDTAVLDTHYENTWEAEGGTAPAAAGRNRNCALVDDGNPEDVLSGGKIVKFLRGGAIHIARRTVAKCHDSMQLPSSVQRRRERALTA